MTRLFRILSIDGGGIRGIIPAQVLAKFEQILSKMPQSQTKKRKQGARSQKASDEARPPRIADFFDMIAGTSTGGILTCLYLCPRQGSSQPRFSASDAVDLYCENGDEIFDVPLRHKIRSVMGTVDEKYPSEGLEELLDQYLGELRLSDLLKPCLIPAYDIRRRRTVFFTQHDAKNSDAADFLLRDVCRATSAAPTYFEVAKVRSRTGVSFPLIDGGVFANNPTLCAYAEARKLWQVDAKNLAILSLGTGGVRKPYYYKEAKDWGLVGWVRPVIDIMMSGVAETVDYQVQKIFESVKRPEQYLRINVELTPSRLRPGMSPDMDDASTENLNGLRELGEELAEEYEDALGQFIKLTG
ncbi:MAG: patatin [Planctomycetes bacterium]|nr:patatin [Planctomycetota bacterium]